MPLRHRLLGTALAVLCLALLLPPRARAQEEARLLRYPDIHRDFVVFCYAGDIWRAPVEGGTARRLTAHEGLELFPKISPDGRWIAYSAEYTGQRQVYVMPAEGGEPKQLTFYGDVGPMPPRGGFDGWILDWSPDGKILARLNRTPWGPRKGGYYLIDPAGGLEEPTDLYIGGSASFSPDGTKLAYCPIDREFRTWKRYRGGRAQDIWVYDLAQRRSTRLTTDPGTDNFPLWMGETLYFTSDRDGKSLQLYAMPAAGGEARAVTHHEVGDVLWPSAGPQAVVYMHDGRLYRFDPATEESVPLPITLGGDLPLTVPHFVDAAAFIDGAALSPSGARVALTARGELFTVPAEHGAARNLSHTPGARERDAVWSPDGKSLLFISDRSGECGLYRTDPHGGGEAEAVAPAQAFWPLAPLYSPDGKKVAYGASDRKLRLLDLASGRITVVDEGRTGNLDTYRWSPDSKWLVYEQTQQSLMPGLALYSVEKGESVMLGDGLTADFSPAFSADGKTLFFLSNRDYQIRFSDFEFNYVYDRATRVYAALLAEEAAPLFPPRSDEEEPAVDGEEDEKEDGGEEKAAPLRYDPAGFLARTVALPGLAAGSYSQLAADEGGVWFVRRDPGERPTLFRYDLEKREAEEVVAGVRSYQISRDGKKLLYRSGDEWHVVDARPGAPAGAGKVDLSHLRVKVDPHAEWNQIFHEAWRVGRDFFYDPQMHGVDWKAVGERYGALLPWVAHRTDLDFLLSEMISELCAGHTYVQGGDEPRVDRVPVGKLGCRFEAGEDGRYRIARIYDGEAWDEGARSPLQAPGLEVAEGDYLLAVDGVELTTDDNPYRLLENKADTVVRLKVNDRPRLEGSREILVRTLSSELDLLYIDWVKSRLARVDELSGGRIGYIHLPDTAMEGNRMLQKLFYGQAHKDALIVDDRYNGGGFIPDRMIEVLSRTTLSWWARRGVESFTTPGFANDGPKAMLINGYAASGGDALPYYFRLEGLGPLVGTRTWGGLIGISGNPLSVDGGGALYPTFRIYDENGKWVVENRGVAPDVEVFDLPEEIAQGRDPSLDRAVRLLLEKLEEDPPHPPERPTPPRP